MDREKLKQHFASIAGRASMALNAIDSMTRMEIEVALADIDGDAMEINELLDTWG